MTDNPSGSTGQNVTTPPKEEREALAKLIYEIERGPDLYEHEALAIADVVLAAGFTRRAQHDGERVTKRDLQTDVNTWTDRYNAAVRERDEARAERDAAVRSREHCVGWYAERFERLRPWAKALPNEQCTEFFSIIANGTPSPYAPSQHSIIALRTHERDDARKEAAALRAQRDALSAKLDATKDALDLRAMAHDMRDKECRASEARAEAAEAKLAHMDQRYAELHEAMNRVAEREDRAVLHAIKRDAEVTAAESRAAALADLLRDCRPWLGCRCVTDAQCVELAGYNARIDAALAGNGCGTGEG